MNNINKLNFYFTMSKCQNDANGFHIYHLFMRWHELLSIIIN